MLASLELLTPSPSGLSMETLPTKKMMSKNPWTFKLMTGTQVSTRCSVLQLMRELPQPDSPPMMMISSWDQWSKTTPSKRTAPPIQKKIHQFHAVNSSWTPTPWEPPHQKFSAPIKDSVEPNFNPTLILTSRSHGDISMSTEPEKSKSSNHHNSWDSLPLTNTCHSSEHWSTSAFLGMYEEICW